MSKLVLWNNVIRNGFPFFKTNLDFWDCLKMEYPHLIIKDIGYRAYNRTHARSTVTCKRRTNWSTWRPACMYPSNKVFCVTYYIGRFFLFFFFFFGGGGPDVPASTNLLHQNIDVLRQTAGLVGHPIKVKSFAYLFSCTTVSRTSDWMTVPS